MRNLVEHVSETHQVVVVTRASANVPPSLEQVGSVEVRRLPDSQRVGGPGITMIRRFQRLLGTVSDPADRAGVKRELRRLRVSSADVVVPCTADEIIAATELRAAHPFVLVPFMLEVLPQGPSHPSIPGILRGLGQRRRRRTQATILDTADHTIALPAAHAALLRDHPEQLDRFTRVEHPMIRKLTPGTRNEPTSKDDSGDHSTTVVYAGGLDRRLRNPVPVLNTLEQVTRHIPLHAHFYSYGNCQSVLQEARFRPWLVSHGRVDPNAAETALGDADVVLTIANAGGDLVPSKIFDCMSTGRPIIHFFHRDDDPYLAYLQRYELAHCVRIGSGATDDARSVADFIDRSRGRSVSFESLIAKFPECTPSAVFDVILSKANLGARR